MEWVIVLSSCVMSSCKVSHIALSSHNVGKHSSCWCS